MVTTADLIAFWKQLDVYKHPLIHPSDLAVMTAEERKELLFKSRSFGRYLSQEEMGVRKSSKLHVSLLPQPYSGNLATAKVVILLLNPGLGLGDYYAEYRHQRFRKKLIANLHQKLSKSNFPFLWLDPENCWHPGHSWWDRKLRDVVAAIANEYDKSYYDTLSYVSKRIAAIELAPYHSLNFGTGALARRFRSVRLIKRFAHDVLRPKALAGRCRIVATRQVREWGLTGPRSKIVLYSKGMARGASLGPNTKGGKAILAALME